MGHALKMCKRLTDCRPLGDDAETGAALNPRKFKRAARRACCFCALRLLLKQVWPESLGTKKPQAQLGVFWGWRSEADGFSAFAVLTNLSLPCA